MLRLREIYRKGKCIGCLQGHMDAVVCLTVDWAGSQALLRGWWVDFHRFSSDFRAQERWK